MVVHARAEADARAMASLSSLVVDLSVNTAALRKGLDEAKEHVDSFGKKLEHMFEAVAGLEAVKLGLEGIAKAGELMEQGLKDAAALGNGPSRELLETFEKVGLATRQLGADLMSDLAPAFNSLISWFTDGADFGKVLAGVAEALGEAFRQAVLPIVLLAGAIKGLADGGTLESALNGAATAAAKLAEHGKSFAGSLKTAQETAEALASMQNINTKMNIGREATQLQANFDNLTGNRRQDRFAGATGGFSDFESALNRWKINMKEAADLTASAASEDAHGSKIRAEALRLQADQATQAGDHAKLAAEAFRFMKEKLIVDTQAINNIHFGLAESVKSIGLNAGVRTEQFNNTYNPTKGFADFGDALEKQTKALENQAGLTAAAAIIEQQYGAAAQGTVLALKAQAEASGRTAEAAKVAADAFFAVKDKLRDQLIGALQIAGESFLSKIGQLGTTINDAIKGFQQGGIWGALAALVMDLLSMMNGWKEIQNIAQGSLMMALKDMASGLGGIIDALKPLMGAIEMIASAVHGVLNPILDLLGRVLKGLVPIFASIGMTMQVMTPIIEMICELLGAILVPILRILDPILTIVAETFLATEMAILALKMGFEMLVDWLDRQFGNGNNQGGIDETQAEIEKTAQQMSDLWNKGFQSMADTTADAAGAMGAAADQTNKNTAAAAKFNQQLTNLPAGFKYLEDRFNAMDPVGAGSGWASGSSSGYSNGKPGTADGGGKGKPAGLAEGRPPPVVHVYVAGSVVVEKDLISSIKKGLDVDHFQRHGVPRP
jgi:hypothetical protein